MSGVIRKGTVNRTLAGSPCWMAPEVMLKAGHDCKADIWSLGILSIELANGHAPYQEFDYGKVMKLILSNEPPSLPGGEWSEEFRKFVSACLVKIPEYRPNIDQLFEDHKAFFAKAKDAAYLKEKWLSKFPPLKDRLPSTLQVMGKQFIEKLN